MPAVSLNSEHGDVIWIDAEPLPGGVQRAGGGAPPAATLEEALDRIRPVANALIQKVRSIDIAPDEIEVKFGVKLSVDANVIISRTAAEANFEFKLVWKHSPPGKTASTAND